MTGTDYIKLQNQGNIISNIRLLYEMMSAKMDYTDKNGYFTKKAVAEIGVNSLLITSGSKVGDEAREIINLQGDESRNSPLQNAKARMQILRVLGLVSSDYGSEIYAITKLGELAVSQVLTNSPNFKLLRELFLGITSDTEIYEHNCSPDFHCYLGVGICYALACLDHRLSTDEMPLLTTYDIDDIMEFIRDAQENRENGTSFTKQHPHYPKTARGNPQKNVSNLTRTINQILRACKIIEQKAIRFEGKYYYVCTEEGSNFVDSIKERFNNLYFLSAAEFRKKNNITWQKEICFNTQNAILRRSGIDPSSPDSNIVFSPYQMLPETTVEWLTNDGNVRPHPEMEDERISVINSQATARNLRIDNFYKDAQAYVTTTSGTEQTLLTLMRTRLAETDDINLVTQEICGAHKGDDKYTFYPLCYSLLRVIGLECYDREVGRFDAYAKYGEHIIPVEIKSYTEVHTYNAKGVRQAIENKILTYNPNVERDLDFASLVIGYSHPTDDAEVRALIDGAKEHFHINVITIDLPSLVKMALNVVSGQRSLDLEQILCQHGIIIEQVL